MKIHICLLATIFSLHVFGQSQRTCGTHAKYLQRLAEDPSITLRRDAMEMEGKSEGAALQKTQGIIKIPVVVHVLYRTSGENISDAQILSQIQVLNKDYRRTNTDTSLTPSAFRNVSADTEIEFCLASTDPAGNATTGIVRRSVTTNNIGSTTKYYQTSQGGSNAWNTQAYLNIWVCNIDGGFTLGFAYLPGTTGVSDDGVVIDYRNFGTLGTVSAPFHLGRTGTHEVGHWLNLEHIWGDAVCGNDIVSDTPVQRQENYDCPSFPKKSNCTGNGTYGDMFMNYMDYSNDDCMNVFTQGQKTRMRNAITTSRKGLLTSTGCEVVNGLTETRGMMHILAYPNPASDKIYVEGIQGNATVSITGISGVKVKETYLRGDKKEIDISTLPEGIYILHAFTQDGCAQTRIAVGR